MKKIVLKILLAVDVLAFLLLTIFSQFLKVFDTKTGVMTDGFGRVLSKTPPILRTVGIYEWAGLNWSVIDTVVGLALILIAIFFYEKIGVDKKIKDTVEKIGSDKAKETLHREYDTSNAEQKIIIEKEESENYSVIKSYKVDFEDIKDDLTTFWVSGKEMFWYQKAWTILEEYGLTSYDDDLECCEVYLRAISLCMIYSDFCKLAFGEYDYYDCYEEKYFGLDDIILGQLYAKLEDVEQTTDKHIIVCELADSKRQEVISALSKKLDDFEIYIGMYFTGFEPYEVSLDTYEEYWDMLLNKSVLLKEDIVSEDGLTFEAQQAYDWIMFDGASRIQEIYY